MRVDPWVPFESLHDSLLTLESAAVLCWPARGRTAEARGVADQWQAARLVLPIVDESSLRGAISRLRLFLLETGLSLPTAAKVESIGQLEGALLEMRAIVEGSERDPRRAVASLALLNLACNGLVETCDVGPEILQSETINKAWRSIIGVLLKVSRRHEGPSPRLLRPAPEEWSAHDPELVGDNSPPWTWGIGPLFHTLAGWDSTWQMQRGLFDDRNSDNARYWAPLPTLAIALLGWSDPAIGVARWIVQGMPRSCPELTVLARVWGHDALRYFSAPQMDWIPYSHHLLKFEVGTSGRLISEVLERWCGEGGLSDCQGLHIQAHLDMQLFAPDRQIRERPRCFREMNAERGRLVLTLGDIAGWYSQLQREGDSLALAFSGTELELTIVAPPVGALGTFSRSTITGVWHSVPHEVHLWGHQDYGRPARQIPNSL